MRSSRVIASTAVAVLVALVAGAVALAASGSGAVQVVPSRLVVGAGPPRTATGVLTYSSNAGISISATCELDFAAGTADVTATASLSIVTATLEARLAERTLFLNVAQFSSLVGANWLSSGALGGAVRLEGLAREMRHPDLARLHAKRRVVTHAADGSTTTAMSFGAVDLPTTSDLPVSLPGEANVTATVTTGASGQLLAATAHLANPSDDVRLSFTVTGYNVPVTVTAPARSGVAQLTSPRARSIFGTNAAGIERLVRGLRRETR